MNQYIKISLIFLTIFFISNKFSIANCDFIGNNPAGGEVIVCDLDAPNPETTGVNTGNNNDDITVLAGAGIDAVGPAIQSNGGDDTIIVNNGNTPEDIVRGTTQAIRTDAGNDDVTINGGFLQSINNDTILTGTEDDRVTVNGANLTSNATVIHTEDGKDEVIVNNSMLMSGITSECIETDEEDDYVEINGGTMNCGNDGIKTEDGNDIIMVNRFGLQPATIISTGENAIDSGIGNDQVTVIGATLQGNPNDGIFTQSGDDMVIVEDAIISSVNFHSIHTAGGNDIIILRGGELIAQNPASLSIRAGSEDDTVRIEESTSLTGLMDGEDGIDTLIFALIIPSLSECESAKQEISQLTGDDSITIEGFTYSWINFEVIQDEIICITPNPIPTLSEWGLIAMAGVLGIAGLLVVRRRKLAV